MVNTGVQETPQTRLMPFALILADVRRRVASCFVALAGKTRIAGYYTLASSSLRLTDLPAKTRNSRRNSNSLVGCAMRTSLLLTDLPAKTRNSRRNSNSLVGCAMRTRRASSESILELIRAWPLTALNTESPVPKVTPRPLNRRSRTRKADAQRSL